MKLNFKSILLLVLLLFLARNEVFAQGFYISIGTGSNFKMGAQNLHSEHFETESVEFVNNFVNISIDNNQIKHEQIDLSFGKGISFGGQVGYMLSSYIGAEVGLSYLTSSKYKSTISTYTISDPNAIGTIYRTMSAKMFRINPAIVLHCNLKKIEPYARFGLIIGIGSIDYKLTEEGFQIQSNGLEKKYSGGVALGTSASLGILFTISERLSLFSELDMVNLSYSPTKVVNEKLDFSEQEQAQIALYYLEGRYDNTYIERYVSEIGDDYSRMLSQKFPFGSFGIKMGLRINFMNSKKNNKKSAKRKIGSVRNL